ncbi:MAG: nucleotidyltransferase family protein [Sulfuricurvum sp.]|uniref:nucleotidyltransferase family protein n=1 Tax=Sulfuricurvum sp. TaxID=2025608 RepID=UPI00271D2796|nr:nucleotidyltransferase family protein [Sulfuricurvum sp.]MDO9057262.1 nucleotidyltransferase family protein [Sulfuricurvum sp.]MDP2851209.1 nucleotidyltransferase family protein [Sulfuricurvum sp.]MDP3292538.1 nucleotidyltransferase family protein [Sulfuricurvum sp.]
MKPIDAIKLSLTSTVRDALQIINNGAMQMAIVTDDQGKLLGTLTDGDIRRGLLDGLSLGDTVETILHTTPTVATLSDTKEDILKKALNKKLHQIPIVDDQYRVLGIQEINDLIQPATKPNMVVLMVGGLGSRLRPLTEETPKPMLKVGNKPILQTIVERFAEYGFSEIIMCVNYKSHIIQDYFGDGSAFGVTITYIFEEERMGTAGALSLLKTLPNEPFFVMNGDLLTNINFDHLCNYHLAQNAMATMCVREYDFQVPYGVVNMEGNTILSIQEKPVHKFYVSAGIYMLSPDVIRYIPKNQFYDMPSLFETLIQQQQKALSFLIREYWLDIGQMEEYERANQEYAGVFQ